MTQPATKDVPSSKDKPHAVLRVTDNKGSVRYAVTMIREDGDYKARYDAKTETCELVGTHANYNSAQASRVALGRSIGMYAWDGEALRKKAANLPDFMPELPGSPRLRRDFFLGLDIEQQEEILYALTVSTGMPLKRIAAWLFLHVEEVEHIDEMITQSARAELDLRIAKKMVGHALANNSPASMTATLYLTKVFLAWNEQGQGVPTDDPMTNLDAAKSLFDDLKVVQTHRDETGKTVAEPTVLQLVRDKREQKSG
jgi:hypothetical protein